MRVTNRYRRTPLGGAMKGLLAVIALWVLLFLIVLKPVWVLIALAIAIPLSVSVAIYAEMADL